MSRPSPYTDADKQEAFGMYLKGYSYTDIAREMNERYDYGIHYRTLQDWSKRQGWSEHREEVELDLVTQVKQSVVGDMKERMAEIELVRQGFLERIKAGETEVRGHEFAKLTEMLNQMGNIQQEKDDLVTRINECIHQALEETELPRAKKQHFLRKYIALLRGDLDE
tara:strand:- start:294 stop:794 length:501 start_codon:yes stop_codon:yes gene_type:complete